MSGDLESFGDGLDELFRRLGLSNPRLQAELVEEWDSLVASPWLGRSKPVVVRGTTLVVEAVSPSMVSLLRYGEVSLLETLRERFGEGKITGVEVVAPGRR